MIQPRQALTTLNLALFFIVGMLTAAPTHAAHPFHSTSTEMEWNPESRRFEVALQLPGLQIDEELSRLHKRHINMESTTDAEQLLEKYIKTKFEVTGKGLDQCQLHWVGVEIDARNVWAYFEVELLPTPPVAQRSPQRSMPEELNVECRYFLDSHEGQVNLITVINETHRASAQLTADQPKCRAVGNDKLEAFSVRAASEPNTRS
ncbi:MAG: hypothetical protein JNL58_01885 [Planctomyces sp.]|nr:hypothetical protein [Planctomyces sp.]